jgi:hypothetical protein
MSNPMRRLMPLLLVALIPIAPQVEAAPDCLLGQDVLYCADAQSKVRLDCRMTESEYHCKFAARHKISGWTGTGSDGQLLSVHSEVQIGVCNGEGFCDQQTIPVGKGCSWASNGRGCSTSGSLTGTLRGAVEGCLVIWIYQDIGAHVRTAGMPVTLASKQAGDLKEIDTCAS